MSTMMLPLSNNPVAAATQAFDNNGFSPLTGIDGTCGSSGKCADNGTAKSIALIINFAQNSAGPGTQDDSAEGFLIKLVLVACEGLAGCKI